MIEIGSRRKNQPAPPHIMVEALTDPRRPSGRQWLSLLNDEHDPTVLRASSASVVWSSIWDKRPDAVIEFDLPSDGWSGTDLRWTLLVDEPVPDSALVGHMCKRVQELINAELRFSFGQ